MDMKQFNMGITTYNRGFDYKAICDITKASFIRILDRLGEVFGDGWAFEIDSACEGGIEVTKWPGKTPEMYKTIRFGNGSRWRTDWENNTGVVWPAMSMRPRTDWSTTCLKAFCYAPPWTTEELKLVAGVLQEVGITSRKVKAPPAFVHHVL